MQSGIPRSNSTDSAGERAFLVIRDRDLEQQLHEACRVALRCTEPATRPLLREHASRWLIDAPDLTTQLIQHGGLAGTGRSREDPEVVGHRSASAVLTSSGEVHRLIHPSVISWRFRGVKAA